jgi:hypothetical protein
MKLYVAEWDFKGNSKLILDYLFRVKPLDESFPEIEKTNSLKIPDGYEKNNVADADEILALNRMTNANEKLLILTSRMLFLRSPPPLGTIVLGCSDRIYGSCIISNDRSFYWLHFKSEFLPKFLRESPSKYEIWDIANAAEELGHLLGLGHHEAKFFEDGGKCLMRGYKKYMEKIEKLEDVNFCEECYKKLQR